MKRRRILTLLPLLAASCCSKSLAAPDKEHRIEFRVLGSVNTVDIAYASTEQGSNLVTTGIPWFALIHTTLDEIFLSISASSFDFGTLSIQIFVDGILFREANADGFEPRVSVSGTWSA